MAMKALTTLEALKTFLKIPETTNTRDDQLNQLIQSVSEAARKIANREFNSAERTEYYDGNGSEHIYLRQRPVTAVGGLWLDANGYYGQAPNGFADPDTRMTPGTDFYAENLESNERNPSRLVLITNPWAFGILNQTAPIGEYVHARWPYGRGNLKVTYTAGYRDIPDDLEMAVHQFCADLLNNPSGIPLRSEQLGRYAYTRMTGQEQKGTSSELMNARSILASYTECAL
jgi:hypothetical protein